MDYQNALDLIEAHKLSLLALATSPLLLIQLKKFFNGGYFNDTTTSMHGKTVIITGANTGIGKETALDLARRGARVIMACRDMKKAEQAAEFVRNESGNVDVTVEELDLASLESVSQFAERINKNEERIDVLMNNAGIMACPKWKTSDGHEMQFGTNHLGHFLLTNLLLDKLKKSAPSRIINVSSMAHRRGRMAWDDINSDKNYHSWTVYEKSKLCNVLFTLELARRLEGTKVTVNSLHPGVVRTELSRHFNGWKSMLWAPFFYPFKMFCFKTVNQGSQTNIYCAVSKELGEVSGVYFADCKKEKLLPHALDEKDARQLWQISEKICNDFSEDKTILKI